MDLGIAERCSFALDGSLAVNMSAQNSDVDGIVFLHDDSIQLGTVEKAYDAMLNKAKIDNTSNNN